MHLNGINGGAEETSRYLFCEGEYSFTLGESGVKCTAERDGKEERFYAYDDVKFYRVVTRKPASNSVKEKLYFTAPVSEITKYNRYRFKDGDKNYFTHEFSEDEKTRAEKAIEEFSVPVTEKVRNVCVNKKLYKTFREDGGLAYRIVALSVAFVFALVLGAVVMYLVNYFLHTDTDTLAVVFGIFCLPFIVIVLIKSQELGSKVKIYDKGVYLKIRSKSGYGGTTSPFAIEKAFLTWEEVESVQRVQSQVQYAVQFRLGYCVFSVPDFNGLYDYLSARFPEKCKSVEA